MLAAALALLSSLTGGTADYLGGSLSRRYRISLLMLVNQVVAATTVGAAAVVLRPFPGGSTWIVNSLVAGASGGVALACFYRALALGPMMLVAPVASTGAVIPIGVGVAEGNAPGPVVAVGIVITLAGLVLATRAPGPAATTAAQPPGKGLALAGLAAVGFGLVLLFLGRASAEGDPLWAVVVSRGMLLVGLLGIVCLTGPGPIPGKADARPIAAMSVLETGAMLTFAIATSLGRELGAMSVLASLAPLVTVLWARHHGRERLSPIQNVGAAATLFGVLVVGVASG